MRDLAAIAALNQDIAARRRWRGLVRWLLSLRPRGLRPWEFGDMT